MKASKLIGFLSNFNDEEMQQFERYLISPYFNTNKKLVQLFDTISRIKRPYSNTALAKQKVYARLYKKATYNDAMMRELMSDLLQAARNFVAHQQLMTDKQQASLLRYQWADTKSDIDLRIYENNMAGKLLDEAPEHNEYYYLNKWNFERNKLALTLENNIGAEHKMLKSAGLYNALHALNSMHLFSFMEISIALRALGRIYNVQPDESLIGLVPGMADGYITGSDSTLSIYYACYQLAKNYEEPFFEQLKALFFARSAIVSHSAKRNAATILENFCSEMLRRGERRYFDTLIEIYREEIEQGLVVEHGTISYSFYQNVASNGVESKYVDWTEEFVERYKDYLPQEYRENVYQHARAYILFARKEYEEALKLALTSYSRYFFMIKPFAKNLLCRIYYELDMHQQVNDELTGYPALLSDPKISATRRESFNVFTDFVGRLLAVKLSGNKQSIKKLGSDIHNEKLLLHKKWFLQKVEELKKIGDK